MGGDGLGKVGGGGCVKGTCKEDDEMKVLGYWSFLKRSEKVSSMLVSGQYHSYPYSFVLLLYQVLLLE